MLGKTAQQVLLTAAVFLSFVAVPLQSQGIQRGEYTGLDKYLPQGRPDNFSFVGVRAAEFLTIPVGSRAIGMGGAYSAVADDISSIWWNPAGIGFLENRQLMVTVVDYTMDLTYTYLAGATPIGDGRVVLGGFLGYLNIPDIEVTTVNQPNGTGNVYNAYDFQMGGSLAINLSDRFTGGISGKFIHQDVWNNISGSAFAIDAGAIYHTELGNREIRFAFAIQNLGTNITMEGPNLLVEIGPEGRGGFIPDGYQDFTGDAQAFARREVRQAKRLTHTYRLPTVVKLALSYNLLTSEAFNWLASGEIWRNNYIPISYTAGTELNYNFTPFLSGALRMGWQVQTDEFTDSEDDFGFDYLGDDPTFRGLSFGGGIRRIFGEKSLQFNYAYRNKGRLSADNFFSIAFGF